jgi:hypothetical protein
VTQETFLIETELLTAFSRFTSFGSPDLTRHPGDFLDHHSYSNNTIIMFYLRYCGPQHVTKKHYCERHAPYTPGCGRHSISLDLGNKFILLLARAPGVGARRAGRGSMNKGKKFTVLCTPAAHMALGGSHASIFDARWRQPTVNPCEKHPGAREPVCHSSMCTYFSIIGLCM